MGGSSGAGAGRPAAPGSSRSVRAPDAADRSGFRRLSEWALGRPAPDDEQERFRSDLVVAFGLGFIALGALIVLATLVAPLPEESRALARRTTPSLMLGLVSSVLCLRFTGSIRLSAHITHASIFAVVGASTAIHGGIRSPVMCVCVMLPIVAGLLAGRRSALFWSGAIVVFLVALERAEHTGWLTVAPLPEATYFPSLLANMTIACVAAAAAVVFYETINRNLRRSLEAERRKLRHAAGHDPLTDLPNRRLFEELEDIALRRADRTKQKVAFVIIDLDDFKPVNDDFGHAWGDEVLKAVAVRLREFTRATDSLARLGGDEFAMLAELLDSTSDAELVAERLHAALATDVEVEPGRSLPVRASIGIALYPDHGDSAATLHEAADLAMYEAKRAGGNQVRFAGG